MGTLELFDKKCGNLKRRYLFMSILGCFTCPLQIVCRLSGKELCH